MVPRNTRKDAKKIKRFTQRSRRSQRFLKILRDRVKLGGGADNFDISSVTFVTPV